jgi:transcriptional regulator with XRE-family HTH domain
MTVPQQGTRPAQSLDHDYLGRAVRELRARRALSQEQLGLGSGLHRNYVGAIERGEITPTFKVLLRLSDGLRMPLSEIFALFEQRREDDPPPRRRRRRRPLGP